MTKKSRKPRDGATMTLLRNAFETMSKEIVEKARPIIAQAVDEHFAKLDPIPDQVRKLEKATDLALRHSRHCWRKWKAATKTSKQSVGLDKKIAQNKEVACWATFMESVGRVQSQLEASVELSKACLDGRRFYFVQKCASYAERCYHITAAWQEYTAKIEELAKGFADSAKQAA